ncbi:MAG: hypothetical protein NT141_01235 [candidate division WWE3 bacterium]|nr:hypothetical protein [candidate division WWE3 bacterium]
MRSVKLPRFSLLIIVVFFSLVMGNVSVSSASVGAGVGAGEIIVTQKLLPGGVYLLPAWPILNTGDTAGTYKLLAEGFDPKWISFTENNIKLAPNEQKLVKVYVNLPLLAAEGVYNGYLDNQLIPSGPVGMGPTAATKLRFTVGRSPGVLGAATQRVYTWYTLNRRLLILLFLLTDLVILYIVAKKYFKFTIRVESKKETPKMP